MSYKRGDLKITRECGHKACIEDEINLCDVDYETVRHVSDSRGSTYDNRGAYLPHSCSEWFIGGPEQITDLILDLQDAREELLKKVVG